MFITGGIFGFFKIFFTFDSKVETGRNSRNRGFRKETGWKMPFYRIVSVGGVRAGFVKRQAEQGVSGIFATRKIWRTRAKKILSAVFCLLSRRQRGEVAEQP